MKMIIKKEKQKKNSKPSQKLITFYQILKKEDNMIWEVSETVTLQGWEDFTVFRILMVLVWAEA